MSVDILKKEINTGFVRNVYLFYGPEEFLIKKYLSNIENMVVNADFKDLNMTTFNGKVDQQKLIDACETVPFLSDKRLVVVRDSGIFKATQKNSEDTEKKSKKNKEFLTDFLSSLPDHLCLVFWENEIDKRIKYIEIIKKKGLLVEFEYQKSVDLTKWVVIELKSQKISISQEDAAFLVEYSEPGMTDINSQLQKLIAFASERGIVTKADIEMVCNKSIKSRIFDLTDAISQRDVKKSLMFLNDMIELKEPVPRIFFMIAKQFRNILTAKQLIDKGANKQTLAQKIGVHPFVAEKLLKQAVLFTMEELKNAVKESYYMDLDNKNSMMDDRISAEILITRFAAKNK